MPVLDNPRHERFARSLAAGLTPSKAYIEAGYNTTTPESTASASAQLASDPDIDARVKELLGRAAERTVINRSKVQEMLLRDREDARSKNQFSVAVRAAELLGKDIGMFIERKEIKTTKLEEMSVEELDELAERIRTGSATSGEDRTDQTREEDSDVLPREGSAS